MGLYLHYQYLLGNIPKRRYPRKDSFELKADLAKLNRISAETKLLFTNRIETPGQLSAYRAKKQGYMDNLIFHRDIQRKALKYVKGPAEKESMKKHIALYATELRKVRRELKHIDDIAERSGVIRENIKNVKPQIEKPPIEKQTKEAERDELFRGSR
jgi:hypothetical protein